MIYARPSATFTALLTNAPTGLVGTLTAGIENTDGTTEVAQSTAGIVEVESGVYTALRTAPADEGEYVLVWKNVGTNAAEELVVTPTPPSFPEDGPDWTPTSADVAAEIPERVKDEVGHVLDDFADDGSTRPTQTQVETIIAGAVRDTIAAVGTLEDCAADNIVDLRRGAKDVATLRAAMRVERTYFPDQIGSNLSPYNAIRDELKDKLATLVEAVRENCGGSGGLSTSGAAQEPSSHFPAPVRYGRAAW